MKRLKRFGGAVSAAVVIALVMSGAAAAETTLCKSAETPCVAENSYGLGTEFSAALEEGQSVWTAGGGLIEITCNQTTFAGKVETATTPSMALSSLSFQECNNTIETLKPGNLTIHHDSEGNGTLTFSGFQIRIKASGLTCTWGGTVKEGVTLTGGSPATIDTTATVPLESGFFCPSSAVWHAKWKVTKPNPLFVSTGV
jgi:hypothetical protein